MTYALSVYVWVRGGCNLMDAPLLRLKQHVDILISLPFCSGVRAGGVHPDGAAHRALRQGRSRRQDARPLGAPLRPRRTHPRLRVLRLQRHQTGSSTVRGPHFNYVR